MGYRIRYPSIRKLHRMRQTRSCSAALTGMCFALFVFLVISVWPEGTMVLRRIFCIDATVKSMETLTEHLKDGMAVGDAFMVFCKEIVGGNTVGIH